MPVPSGTLIELHFIVEASQTAPKHQHCLGRDFGARLIRNRIGDIESSLRAT